MPKLRKVDLYSLDDVIAEITRLREGGYAKGGNWDLSQLCDHLRETMRIGLDGSVKPLPYLVRATLGNFMFWLLTRRITRGLSGVKTLPQLEPEPREEEESESIDACLDTLREARDRKAPLPPYPFTTSITLDLWRRMMVVHAQHHLEFLSPTGAA